MWLAIANIDLFIRDGCFALEKQEDLPLQELIDETLERFKNRPLTTEERK